MDIVRAEHLLIELRDNLYKSHRLSLWPQIKNAADAVNFLKQASSDEEKEDMVRHYYHLLFAGRNSLSEICLWDDDFETRKKLNEPLRRIDRELNELINNSAEVC